MSSRQTDHVHPPRGDVIDAVRRALAEDLQPLGDLTASLLPPDVTASADFKPREAGRVSGIGCATEAFLQVDPGLQVEWTIDEGDAVAAGQVIGTVSGSLASILTAERTALNFLCHLSGISTRVGRWMELTEGRIQVWDTRKTIPGLRSIQKAAVRAGGGVNHRGNLSDWIMFKDNHLTVLGITEAIRRARETWPARTVHVEADRLEQMVEAIEAGADVVLLDNMSPDEVRACVDRANQMQAGAGARRVLLEVSGGIDDENLASYADTGADLVSSGSLTNSTQNLDIGLDIGLDKQFDTP
jgi:nicotinate-nucleotide pyrophosphorylase (carboxylating)